MRIAAPAILVGLGALATWIVVFNVRGRRRERSIRKERGVQTACDFAVLFDTPTQRFIAEKLFPYLQKGTFSKDFSFCKDDKLWSPPLALVPDDLEDNLRLGFWDELDLGLTAEDQGFSRSVLSVATVGELVERISAIYEERYGSVEIARTD